MPADRPIRGIWGRKFGGRYTDFGFPISGHTLSASPAVPKSKIVSPTFTPQPARHSPKGGGGSAISLFLRWSPSGCVPGLPRRSRRAKPGSALPFPVPQSPSASFGWFAPRAVPFACLPAVLSAIARRATAEVYPPVPDSPACSGPWRSRGEGGPQSFPPPPSLRDSGTQAPSVTQSLSPWFSNTVSLSNARFPRRPRRPRPRLRLTCVRGKLCT